MKLCIYGASSNKIDKIYIEKTEELGKKLASRGHGLVFGGGANGLMGAAARGFFSEGGGILGVAPRFFNADGVLFENCTEFIYTDTMRERKRIMEENADAFIVTPGGIGTFEEFFEILTLKQLGRHNKAIVVYNILGYYDSMQKMLDVAIEGNFMKDNCRELYKVIGDADDLVSYLEGYNEVDGVYKDI